MPNPYDQSPEDEYPEEQNSQPPPEYSSDDENQNQSNSLDDLQNAKDLKDRFSGSSDSGGAGGEAAAADTPATEGVTSGVGGGTAATGGAAEGASLTGSAGVSSGAAATTGTGAAASSAGAGAVSGGVAAAGTTGTTGVAAAGGATAATGGAAAPVAVAVAVEELARNEKTRKYLIGGGIGVAGLALLPFAFVIFIVILISSLGGGITGGEAAGNGGGLVNGSNILKISKTASPNIIAKDAANATVTYTITVTNNSTTDATGVTVSDGFASSPPEASAFAAEVTGYEPSYSIGALAGGGSNVKSFTVSVPHTNFDPGWLLTNTSQVAGMISGKTESSSSSANVVIGKPVSVPPVGCPFVGFITTPYGSNIPGYADNNGVYIGPHAGIDIADGPTDDLYATMTGNLTYYDYYSTKAGSMTRTMKISNGIYQVQYYHVVDATRIPEGPVVIGQKIGQEDETGYVFGKHLHYEVGVNDSLVDPSSFLGATLYYTQPANNDFSGMAQLNPWGKCDNPPEGPVVPPPPPPPVSALFIFSDAGQKPWTQAEKDMVNQAIITPTTSSTWKNLVFSAGKVTVLRSPVDNSCPDVCSGFAQDANTLVLRDKFFTLTDRGKGFVITHELTHIIQDRNPQIIDTFKASSAYQEYLAKGVIASYPLCSGFTCPGQPDLSPLNEDFAEMAGNYVSDRDGYPLDFPVEYPEHYKFARDTLFGGTSF